jgi:hypothetical protein
MYFGRIGEGQMGGSLCGAHFRSSLRARQRVLGSRITGEGISPDFLGFP